MCHEQWVLTVIKLLRFFVLIFAVFLPVIQVSWKLWMFLISTPHKTRMFTMRLAVTTKYQGNGFAAQVLLGRDHPRVIPIVTGVIAFTILGTRWDATTQVASQSVNWQSSYGISNSFQQRLSAILNFKNFNIWLRECHYCPNLLLYTKFHFLYHSSHPSFIKIVDVFDLYTP